MAKKRTMNEYRQTKEHYISRDQEAAKQMAEIDRQECSLDPVEEAKILIASKITKHFQDKLFEMVCEGMMDYPVFQSQTYLTEEGYDQFEDEWFEFYHEHHGDILHEVTQNITN